ncbi:MAG: hypothetical protein WDN50_13555 [Bradyrhizobium sp.]
MSVLQSAYSGSSSTSSLISPGDKFTKVDPTKYQGTWTGTDYKHQPVTVSITKVQGYRANVTLQTSAGLQYQQAFITTKGTFRIGDSKFTLTGTRCREDHHDRDRSHHRQPDRRYHADQAANLTLRLGRGK